MNKKLVGNPLNQKKFQLFNIISLNSCIYSCLIFLLQIYLIILQIKYLISYKNILNNQTAIYVICLMLSILFTIINLFINMLRIGNYSHDCVKLGKDFNLYISNKLLKFFLTNETIKQQQQPKTILNKLKTFFLHNKIWKHFLPIGQILHLLSSFSFLYIDLISNKRLIELKYLPIGEIFSTKLDFLFDEPINRIQFIKNQNQFQASNDSSILSTIIKSTDDFVNSNGNNKLINISYLNLIIGLVVFTMKISQTFWHTNRFTSLLTLIYTLNLTILTLLSYSSFEILFKFQVLISQHKLNIDFICI
jgi:hypothetical protein